jgi:hypothetical protein
MEKKTYQVWHDAGGPQSRLGRILEGRPATPFPEGYVHVANVQAIGLGDAVERTRLKGTIREFDGFPWQANPGVESASRTQRDTDEGDVIVDPHGQAYRVERHGLPGQTDDRGKSARIQVNNRRPDAFDSAVANLRRQWRDDGLDDVFGAWRDLPAEDKVGYLATFAAVHDVTYQRFAKAAQHVLGAKEFSGDDEWHLRRQLREARRQQGLPANAPEPGFTPILKDEAALSKDFQKLLDDKSLLQPTQDKQHDKGIER